MTTLFAPFVVAFIALMLWRGSLTALTFESVVGGSAARQRRKRRTLQHGVHLLDNRLLAALLERQERANNYLRRIVALCGAEQTPGGYVLNVGAVRFCVSDRHVTRLRGETGSAPACEETCFYSLRSDIPRTEEIASALIQLRNNPALFDHWAIQYGAVKADGQPFSSKH